MAIVKPTFDRRRGVIILLLAVALLAGLIYIALSERTDTQVIGRINQQPVTLERFEDEIRLQQVRYQLVNRPEQEVIGAELLNRMVGDLLLVQAAENADVAVEQEEVDSEIDVVLSRTNSSRQQMTRILADHRLDWEVFERSIREYLTVRRFQDEVLLAEVPARERSAFLREWLSENFQQAEIEFDAEFLATVNSADLSPALDPGG